MTEDNRKAAHPENAGQSFHTWFVTIAVSFGLLVAMYGFAYLNDAHVRVMRAATDPVSAAHAETPRR